MAANPYTTNLELQLDSRDITGLSDGDSVATWADSSAAGNDLSQSNASFRPTYKTNIIGSNPVVRWGGSAAISMNVTFGSSWSGYDGVTAFFLVQYYAQASHNYPQLVGFHGGSGNDYDSVNGFIIGGGAFSNTGIAKYGRNCFGLWRGGVESATSLGGLRYGAPSVIGLALKQGANGVKHISEYGAVATGESFQIPGTPTGVVLGNAYQGGFMTTLGLVGDVAMALVYKEYMSDSNIADVVDWMLTEFDLHTQAAGGSGGVLIRPGMTGGMIG